MRKFLAILVCKLGRAVGKLVDETAEAEMGKLTGGMNIPGL